MGNQGAQQVMMALKKIAALSTDHSLNDFRMVLALERAVARMDNHPVLSSHLVFKGGFVLLKTTASHRFTRDVDALALGVSRKQVPEMMTQALSLDLDDSLWFGDLETRELTNQGPYGGYNFSCAFQIGQPQKQDRARLKKLSRIHIDVGFGDALKEIPKKQLMQSILMTGKPVSWSVYPFEYIFSEKLEALFSRQSSNSRSKDIYDMVLIFKNCEISALLSAIKATFENRNTPVPHSFEKTARSFDVTIMRRAWASVELSDARETFDATWDLFLTVLKVLDRE